MKSSGQRYNLGFDTLSGKMKKFLTVSGYWLIENGKIENGSLRLAIVNT